MSKLGYVIILCFLSLSLLAKESDLTSEQVNKAIKNSPNTLWTAGDNKISNRYPERFDTMFGLSKDDDDYKWWGGNDYYTPDNNDPLPESFDWRNFAGQNWISSIKDQGRCGSCVTFATIGMVEAQYNISSFKFPVNLDLSEQYVQSCSHGDCTSGSGLTTMIKFIKENDGVTDEACFPYISGNVGLEYNCSRRCPSYVDRLFSVNWYKYVGSNTRVTTEDIKRAILHGPVLTQMDVFKDFMFYLDGVYKHVIGELLGAHAIVLVGWNELEHAWIVKNSWNTDWGMGGYFKIDYDDTSNIARRGIVIGVNVSPDFIKINSPLLRTVIKGLVGFKVETNNKNLKNIKLYLSKHNDSSIVSDLQMVSLDKINYSTLFNTVTLIDGFYDFWFEGITSTDTKVLSSKSAIYIVNNKPAITVSMRKYSTAYGNPDYRYVLIECNVDPVPLTYLELTYNGPDGYKKLTKFKHPCPSVQLGIKYTELKPGKYVGKAKGWVGENYEFDVPEVIEWEK